MGRKRPKVEILPPPKTRLWADAQERTQRLKSLLADRVLADAAYCVEGSVQGAVDALLTAVVRIITRTNPAERWVEIWRSQGAAVERALSDVDKKSAAAPVETVRF